MAAGHPGDPSVTQDGDNVTLCQAPRGRMFHAKHLCQCRRVTQDGDNVTLRQAPQRENVSRETFVPMPRTIATNCFT